MSLFLSRIVNIASTMFSSKGIDLDRSIKRTERAKPRHARVFGIDVKYTNDIKSMLFLSKLQNIFFEFRIVRYTMYMCYVSRIQRCRKGFIKF